MEFIRPCRSVTDSTVEYLNNLEKYDSEYLDAFQGSRPTYSHLDLKSHKFLEEHSRKGSFILLFIYIVVSSFYYIYLLFLFLF